ncbi:hypothetical protein CIK05_04065 [Bdellovibrio sp. qaytius]|nr:hypothetical protein CIK05_04065 [Bdellovibrio sp. qaytius]
MLISMSKLNIILLGFSILVSSVSVQAAGAPLVGRKAAAKYFQAKGDNSYEASAPRFPSSIESLGSEDHFMALGLSSYTNSKAYKWGTNSEQDVARTGLDMTYRLTQEYQLFDEVIRVSYNTYKPAGQKASKMSFLYGLTFPDATSKFPLYFGLAAGPGIFFNQIDGESAVAFDYQMFLGLRLFNLFEKTGFFVEGGIKNHLHLTSDGQLNGTFVSAGAVFTF